MRLPLALACLLLFAAEELRAGSIRIRGEMAGGGPAASGKATVRLVPQSSGAEPALSQLLTATLEIPGETVIEVPAGPAWRIDIESPELWGETQWLPPVSGDETATVLLRLFPVGTLTGALEPFPAVPTGVLEARFEAAPGAAEDSRLPRSTLDCRLRAPRFVCRLPAGKLDLRLRMPGFIPRYLWDLSIRPGESHDLGRVVLKKGASVVGWVRSEPQALSAPPARLELKPYLPGHRTEPVPRELSNALSRQSAANPRGFFQFEEVPPGVYIVQASRAGTAPARVFPVEVLADLEAEVREPLVLASPVSARILFDPPRDPHGAAWQIELIKDLDDETVRGVTSPEGAWERADLAPGGYELRVTGGSGSVFLHQNIELAAGQPPLHLSIPVVRIRGRITLGEDPLEADLWFSKPADRRRVHFRSDSAGELEGALPEEGLWKVDLRSEAGPLRVSLETVEVRVPKGKSYATVELRVPDTLLQGEVVDEQGRPLPQAAVLVSHIPGRNSQFFADAEGRFEIRGLPPGRSSLEAHAEDRTSGWIEVFLEEEKETPPLRVVARSKMEVQGRVVSIRGAVPGARLHALPRLEGSFATVSETMSRADGSFSLPLPAGTRSVSLTVFAPGYALRMLEAAVSAGEFLEIPLESPGGTLILELGKEGDARGVGLLHGGIAISLEMLARWSQGTRSLQPGSRSIALPDMEPGNYQVCRGKVSAETCSGGYLGPLRELVLSIP